VTNPSRINYEDMKNKRIADRRVDFAMSPSTIIVLKTLADILQLGSKNEHFASFLRTIWTVAGHAKRWHGREKSKASPNLRVGLPQFSTVRSV
jgi:type IV secretory pathway TrbD component